MVDSGGMVTWLVLTGLFWLWIGVVLYRQHREEKREFLAALARRDGEPAPAAGRHRLDAETITQPILRLDEA